MPPAMRSAEAPSDSPIAKPKKQTPTIVRGTNSKMITIITSSSEIRNRPMDMPARSGMLTTSQGCPLSEANAVRELAQVLTRMPYQATQYEPPMPTTANSSTRKMVAKGFIGASAPGGGGGAC